MSLTPSRGERAGRDGAFTSRRGPGEGSVARGSHRPTHGDQGTASRPPTSCRGRACPTLDNSSGQLSDPARNFLGKAMDEAIDVFPHVELFVLNQRGQVDAKNQRRGLIYAMRSKIRGVGAPPAHGRKIISFPTAYL